MKQIIYIFILGFITGACSSTKKTQQTVFKITVIDKNNNSLIDSAKVTLTALIDSRDIYKYVKYTDTYGRCNFSFDYNPLAQYRVGSMKNGFIGYYDESFIDLDRAFSVLNEKTGNIIDLYLTSDTLNHRNFWASHTTHYDIDTLIYLLKSNSYPLRFEFPLLQWEDIPELLAIGNNSILINKYPISVTSSSYQKDCYLGIVSLWFIESIRISELKMAVNPYEKFPSQTPSLHYMENENQESTSNSAEIMQKAYQSYLIWWEKVKGLDKDHACKINPFENINLEWR